MSTKSNVWIISVGGGYGDFEFIGTERQAEEMRRHKARWEHAVATKQRKETSIPTSPKLAVTAKAGNRKYSERGKHVTSKRAQKLAWNVETSLGTTWGEGSGSSQEVAPRTPRRMA